MKPFIPKENPDIPDFYTASVYFIGMKDPVKLELVSHYMVDVVRNKEMLIGPHSAPYLEYVTHDDERGIIPLSSVSRIQFDKAFTKLKELQTK